MTVEKTLIDKLWILAPLILQGALTTIFMTIVSVTVGLLGGFISGFITCKKIHIRWLSPIIHIFEFIIKGTPVFVQLLIIYLALPKLVHINVSPMIAGIITISLTATARFAEIVRHDVDMIPEGQWESCRVLGYSTRLILWAIVLPQVLRSSFHSFVGESISLLKETYIVSILGTLELTKVAMNTGSHDLDPVTAYVLIAFVYLGIVGGLTFGASLIEKRYLKSH